MEDNYKHKGIRRQLVALLQSKGIKNQLVLQAIEAIPRHLFLDSSFLKFAYQDEAFPIGAKQTISHPYTVAFQTELLELKKGDKVLEVGTGSGYQTAVLCYLGAKVFTIERQKTLYDKTKIFLPTLGYNAKFFYGDGYKGIPPFAPYDKIIVTAGAPLIPEALMAQLKVGGKLVIPVGDDSGQQMISMIRKQNGFEQTTHGSFKFVPLLEQKV
ncbi:MAG TPA: protein-L-isoaspartate(D-aspartate) O-methyltransferase [Bacteroidia bacterium]|nr:protein-L-isoaspartate(D-aspartate) O-methyltransferase [Bacteroidia bacterium]